MGVPVLDGFKRVQITLGGMFIDRVGPFWINDQDGKLRMGVRIDERHCSGYNVCHGGFLATFADLLLPLVTYHSQELVKSPQIIPTLSLQLDYIAPVKQGDRLEGEADLLKITRFVLFVRGLYSQNVNLRCDAAGCTRRCQENYLHISEAYIISNRVVVTLGFKWYLQTGKRFRRL